MTTYRFSLVRIAGLRVAGLGLLPFALVAGSLTVSCGGDASSPSDTSSTGASVDDGGQSADAAGSATGACSVPEGAACTTGLKGACGVGHEKCVQGALSCVPDLAPGERAETCNGVDDDCDGEIDNGSAQKTLFKDEDGDGFGGAGAIATPLCLDDGAAPPKGYALTNDDCDDSKSDVFPGAPELCDGVLNNCTAGAKGMPADYVCPSICAGAWPVALGGGGGTVSVAQLDDDPELEVIASMGGVLRVVGHDAATQWSGTGSTYSYPTLADVDHDDTLDLLVPHGNTLLVYMGKTGAALIQAAGITAASSSGNSYGATAFDIDNDGWVDVVPTQNGSGPSDLVHFNGTSNPVVRKLLPRTGEAAFVNANAVFVDFDRDGISDIGLGSGSWTCKNDPTSCMGRFLRYGPNGALLGTPQIDGSPFTITGFPEAYSGEAMFPMFADFDHDGVAELAARFSSGPFVWDRAGAIHPLNKSSAVGTGVHFAPINADGTLNDGKLVAVGGPVVDLDGDGRYEVFQQSTNGLTLRSRGGDASGYPIPIKGGAPIVSDINRDGALDVLWIGNNSALNCYTLKSKTYTSTQVLTAGGYATVGAPGVYPTFQHDPFEPNQPSTAIDPKTSTNPARDFRTFAPWGMRDRFQVGAGNVHTVVAELGEKGDEDWYFISNPASTIGVTPHVPSKADVTLDVYQYAENAGAWKYQCQASGKSLKFQPETATGDCPAGISGTRGLLIRVRGVSPDKDWGPYPYSLDFTWR